MKFEQTIELPGVSPERVWAFVMDVPSMAKCIPGCDGVEDLGGGRYKAVVKIKVGPIGLSLASEISIVEKDETNRTASLQVEAADKRVGGAVKATMSMKLTPAGDGSKLEVSTDANVMGRIGDFGQSVIRKKADQTLQEVAENLRKALA
ncbi:MAG TPA: SRPBCC family protein [Candidatus Lustribacter sp.]|jgi:carbon monoxide dehydrogenase subunit G|nr:SRPBCC family protein [Candidatus Lustribacter sp.]